MQESDLLVTLLPSVIAHHWLNLDRQSAGGFLVGHRSLINQTFGRSGSGWKGDQIEITFNGSNAAGYGSVLRQTRVAASRGALVEPSRLHLRRVTVRVARVSASMRVVACATPEIEGDHRRAEILVFSGRVVVSEKWHCSPGGLIHITTPFAAPSLRHPVFWIDEPVGHHPQRG